MIDCDNAREQMALLPSGDDENLREHLAECALCASYRRQHQALDLVLRAELQWQAPAALTARLLALTGTTALAAPRIAPFAARPRPKGWYVTTVYALTMVSIALSLLVAWQFFGLLAMEIGLDSALAWLLNAPAQGLAQLTQFTQALPESRYAIAFFLKVRDQLMWLLIVAVLWVAMDRWNPQFGLRRGETSS